MQSTLNVIVVSQEDIELFNDALPTNSTVGDLKRRLDDDPLCVDLLTKHRQTKEWTLLLSSEDCSLISIREMIAHPRQDGALHFKVEFRAVWRIQAFIGLFADPFVSKLDLEGGYLMRTIRETRVMLNSVLSSPVMPSFSQSVECKAALSSVVAHLESAEKWEVNLYQDYGITRFLGLFLSDVQALEVGKMMVWGGGWNRRIGHGVMHVLQRNQEDSFSLTTCNTGEGLQYHNASARCFPKEIFNHFLEVRDIPRARLVEDFSWAHMLWGLRFESLDSNCSQVLYEVVLPHLNGGPVRDSSDDLASTSSRLERDVTSETGTQDEELDDGFGVPQRSGTCAARSVLAVVKYLLKRFGINRPDRKLIFYSFRLAYLQRVEASLLRNLGILSTTSDHKCNLIEPQVLNQSDVALITFALSQTSRAALKLVERRNPLLRENELHALDDQITRIRRLLERLKNFQTATFLEPRVPLGLDVTSSESHDIRSQQAELVLDSTECAFHPFVHFDFVASSGSCELLAGAPLPRSSLVLLDPNATTPSSYQREISHVTTAVLGDGTSPNILRLNIIALRQMSDELRNKGDNVASIKIVALIQHAFTCAFPIPKARNVSTCPWSFVHSSSHDQLELLQNLFAIAKTFLDASLRLLPSHFCSSQDPASDEATDYNQAIDDLDGPRSITFACIVAVADAIVSSGTKNESFLSLTKAFEVFHFFPAMDDFAGSHFEVLTSYYTVTRPELVTARELVSSYFLAMRAPDYHGQVFGNWTLDAHGGISIRAHEGEMALFESLSQIAPKLQAGRALGNDVFANWFCGLGSQEWDQSELNETIPEVNIYLMLLMYCKIALSPWKLIRKFIFPEDSSGHDSRYTSRDQLEPDFRRSSEVDPVGHVSFKFKNFGSRDGAEFENMIHDDRDGLIALHEIREQEAIARFQPNDEHVMCTDTFLSIKHLVNPEADAVYLTSLLLVPAIAVPYCLQFFSDKRLNLLESNVLQKKLWKTLFSPHVFQSDYEPIAHVPISGNDRPQYLGTPRGLLMHELEHSPEAIMEPISVLLQQICELAEDAITGFSRRRLLLFILRCSCIIEHFAASAQTRALPKIQSMILKNRRNLQLCQRKCIPILEGWIQSYDASLTASQQRQHETEMHSSLAILHSIPLFDKMDPPIDFGAFYFSACSVMTMLQAQYSAFCPIFDVLHAIHRLRWDATELTKHNVEQRDRILRWMWHSQKSGPLPAPKDSSSPWRQMEFDLGVIVEQKITLNFGRGANSGSNTFRVSFPGVNRVSIHADAIDEGLGSDSESFFTIFRSNSNCDLFEGSKERWYQSDLKQGSLVADIVSDSFDLFKYSRGSSEGISPWNIHLHARAPVSFHLARTVAETVFDGQSVDFLHIKAAAVALARTGHDQSRATEYITQLNDSDRKELFSFAESKLPSGSKRVLDINYNAQFQHSATRGIYFNIQTAEVVYQDGSLSPIPEDIALHSDFSGIFGSNAPQCSVLQPETNRRRYAIVDVSNDTKFEVACWKPQTRDEFNYTLRRAKILVGESVPAIPGLALSDASDSFSKQVASGVIGIPICCDDGTSLSFCGHFFQRYEKGSCGWFSSLLDDIVLTSANRHSMPQPLIWICQSKEASALFSESQPDFIPWAIILAESSLEADKSAVMKGSQCSFDANGDLARKSDMARGFYEVLGNVHWMSIECFALRERGRAISREIVYTSDARLSLADLPESSRPTSQPMKHGREHEAGDMFSGMPISKSNSEFLGSPGASSEEWKDPCSHVRETLVITRTRKKRREIVETLVPHSSLRGLIPEVLLENFTFWMQGCSSSDAGNIKVIGELRRDADTHFMGWGQEATIEVEINSAGNRAKLWRRRIIRRCADDGTIVDIGSGFDTSSGDDDSERQQLFAKEALINLQMCSKTCAMGRIVQELAHVDNLSHILVWGKDCSESTVQLNKIEMPRAGIFLRFQADDNVSRILGQRDADSDAQPLQTTLIRVYSEDDDTFLGKSNMIADSISQFLHAMPHGAVFCNRSQQRFLVVPLWEPRPLKIALCPFEGVARMRKPRRVDTKRSLLKRITTKFQLHIGGTFLHSPDIFSSIYLALLHFVKLDYLSAARVVRSCVIDGELSDEMKWILRLIGWTQLEPTKDLNPNAVALRLRIALQCCDGQLQECPWDLDLDYQEYLKKISHVFPQCTLSRIEELMLLKQLISGSHRKNFKESEVQDECNTLKLENRLKQLSSESPGSQVDLVVRNQQIGGVRWANFLAKYVRDFLVDRKCGYPSQNWKSMHKPGESFDSESATQLLMTIRRHTKGGNFSSVGFYPLYEVLAGYIKFNAVGVTDDHALASMMLQVVWLTASKQCRITLPREDNLCVFVLAMMSARGFNDHMKRTHGHSGLLKNFPGYTKKRTSTNVQLLCGEGIKPRHPRPSLQSIPTFSQRLEGAACAVMRNRKRDEDRQLFTSTPPGNSDDDGDMERIQRNCYKDPIVDRDRGDDEMFQLDEMYGASPQFWSEHLKMLGHGAPLFKENHTAAVTCNFSEFVGASNCNQSKLGFSKITSNVSARSNFCVKSEDEVEQQENGRQISLDDAAMSDLIDVIESVPRLSRYDPETTCIRMTPVLSCVHEDIPNLLFCSEVEESLCEIPFPATFAYGAAKDFEAQARSKMAKDLQRSRTSYKFEFHDIGPIFQSAMQCESDTLFDDASSELFQKAISKLHDLYACLEKHRQSTQNRVRKGVNAVNRLLFSFDDSGFGDGKSELSILTERLARTSSRRPEFKFDDLVAICLSTSSLSDLSACNSFLPPLLCPRLIEATAAVMMHAVRLGHIIRCLSSTVRLIDDLLLFASERICARYRKTKLVTVKDMLISKSFSPCLVQGELSTDSFTGSFTRSDDRLHSSESYDDQTFSAQANSDFVGDEPTSQHKTGWEVSSRNTLARSRSLRSTVKKQTSVETPKRKQFSHINIQLKTIGNSAASLAGLLMDGRDYSVFSLHRIRSQVSDQGEDIDLSSLEVFDPRFLVVEFIKEIVLRPRQVELCETLRFRMQGFDQPRSAVHQMIMGAGKTHVVTPLLALLLADSKSLVTVVVPRSLLELSRSKLRETFSTVVPRFVFTLNFERLPQLHSDIDHLSADGISEYSTAAMLGNKLDRIRCLSGICITTPDAVKSVELSFIDLLFSRDRVRDDPFGPGSEKLIKMKDVIYSLHNVLNLWRQKGLALFDEVDMILHPLRSELNFPMGTEKDHDLADTDRSAPRWQLPSFLFEVLLQAATDASQSTRDSPKVIHSLYPFLSSECRKFLLTIVDNLCQGARARDIRLVSSHDCDQRSGEHFAILNPTFYNDNLRNHMSIFGLEWVQHKLSEFQASCVQGVSFPGDQDAWDRICPIVRKFIMGLELLTDPEKDALRLLGPTSVMLLTLAKQWITVYLPHCCSLFNRVHYGLLQTQDIKRLERQGVDPKRMPGSRLRNAVPFVGKDSPSRASEFAQPDISAGLTILAYRYEGMRRTDMHNVVQTFQNLVRSEIGPMSQRKHYLWFGSWLQDSKHRLRHEVPPLDKLQLHESKHLDLLMKVLARSPGMLLYHTEQTLRYLKNASHQLQASGADLGGDVLFHGRVGFSGTPSDLLPHGMGPCHFEPGSEAAMIRVLSSQSSMGKPIELREWNVDDLLMNVAKHDPPLRALIDVGALVTGMSNEQVAERLLELDAQNKYPRFEACVFLNEHDVEMVKIRKGGETSRLSYSPYKDKPELRFTFYDQIHTTGIDIKQSPDAHAAVTIGKDLTIRDFAQGCYRMRQLGKGQVVHCVWVPEVMKLVTRTKDSAESLLIDAVAWLTSRYIQSEVLQFSELCRQTADSFPRRHALSQLLHIAPDACSKMDVTAAKLRQLSRAQLSSESTVQFDPATAGKGAKINLDSGVVHFKGYSSVLCTGEFSSGINRLSFRNLGRNNDNPQEGTQCLWGIARKLEFIDCETYLGNQTHCIGMLGCNNVFANRKMIHGNNFHVLRGSIVTVIADCIRREVRWEVDGRAYPFKASFESVYFPKQGASFKFAVGGSGGPIGGKTIIVDERNEAIVLLKGIENFQHDPQIQKMKMFLDRALQDVQSGISERDFHFHYDLDSSDKVAQLCNIYIHACGFEDSNFSSSIQLSQGSLVTLSSGCTDHELLKPGDVGEIIVVQGSGTPFPFKVQFEGKTRWYPRQALMAQVAQLPEKEGCRYSLLQGFDLALLKGGVSALNSLLHPQESIEQEEHARFPDELLGQIDQQLMHFFVRDRVGGIFNDPNGPPGLADVILSDWESRGRHIFHSDMQQLQDDCQKEVDSILEKLQALETGASITSTSVLSTEMVTEKEVELEVQVVKEVARMPPAPVDTMNTWALKSLSSCHAEELPFFPASELSFHDINLPFPESMFVSRNFCTCKPEGLLSVAHFALNWNNGTCIRTAILSLAEAVAVRRAAQRRLYDPAASGTSTYEILQISQDCKSNLTTASRESFLDWYRRLSCCRFIQGDVWMSWPDDRFLLQAFESSGKPLCDVAPPARREKWFMQCLLSQRHEASASCVVDGTAPICVGLHGHSSFYLEEQQRILDYCRTQLAKSKIDDAPELLRQLNSCDVMEFSSQEQLLQSFFHLSLDEAATLSMRLKRNSLSEITPLPLVVNVFFEQSAKTPFVDYDPGADGFTDVQNWREEEYLEDDPILCRMQSNNPMLLKNQTDVSAIFSSASKGGQAVQHLPQCDITAGTDEVGSFHVEIVPFAREEHKSVKSSVEPFGGARDSDDDEHGEGDTSSKIPHRGEWRDVKRQQRYSASGDFLGKIKISDSGPSSHSGQWRDKRETRYHCATKSEERHNGGPLCQHEGGIIQDSHWSCCGSLSMNSKCSMAKSSFPCNLTLPSPAPLPSAAVVPKLMAKISQFNSEFAERKRLQLTPQELNGVQELLQSDVFGESCRDAIIKGMQWPHDKAFPILDVLRTVAVKSTTTVSQPCDFSCNTDANVLLGSKSQIGDKWINFVQAVASLASASDGSYIDSSRMMSLRCCNNLMTLPGLHFQVAADVEPLIDAFKSSASSSSEGIRSEWALFVRNVVAIMFHTKCGGTEAQVLACANFALDIIRSAPPTAGFAVWNAVLALGTCAHFSPEIKSRIAASGAKRQEALTRIIHTFSSADSANTVSTEALLLFK